MAIFETRRELRSMAQDVLHGDLRARGYDFGVTVDHWLFAAMIDDQGEPMRAHTLWGVAKGQAVRLRPAPLGERAETHVRPGYVIAERFGEFEDMRADWQRELDAAGAAPARARGAGLTA